MGLFVATRNAGPAWRTLGCWWSVVRNGEPGFWSLRLKIRRDVGILVSFFRSYCSNSSVFHLFYFFNLQILRCATFARLNNLDSLCHALHGASGSQDVPKVTLPTPPSLMATVWGVSDPISIEHKSIKYERASRRLPTPPHTLLARPGEHGSLNPPAYLSCWRTF
jgi:hypothetical protein